MANILSLVWYKILPASFGGQKGIARFSHYLGMHHKLYCLCSRNNQASGDESFKVINELPESKWQFIDPTIYHKIRSVIHDHKITHLVLEHCYHGFHGIRLARKLNLKLLVHSHNIEYQRFREMKKWWWPLLYLLEKRTHRAADLSLFKTETDQSIAIRQFGLDAGKCMIVPYGIERNAEAEFEEKQQCRQELETRHGINKDTRIILFNGTLDYEPNALALKHIVNHIIPALEKKTKLPFMVLVTGRIIYKEFDYLLKLHHPRYLNAGYVKDVDTYFKGADIFINPLIQGGGVKVKLVEALSFGLPVISYVSGAHGMDITLTGNKLSIIEDGNTEAFADALIGNWNNTEKLPPEFFSRYSWKAIAAEVAERIEQL
ncbi:MAG TPA: glycosyltransferase family 4 protein [Chitinophagaceae bacterium]|nr:glycosyltransferase family 4 protein [Chitinophagaceae bacterium]